MPAAETFHPFLVTPNASVARIAPFFVFVLLTALQGYFGGEGRFWIYLAKTLLAVAMLWQWRWAFPEVRLTLDGVVFLAGALIALLWVGLDGLYPKISSASVEWNPIGAFPEHPLKAWLFIGVRLVGATLIVPVLEELFYRSFFYRRWQADDFLTISLGTFHKAAFLVTAIVFGFAHHEWLPGILCGLILQWLVVRRGHLGDAIIAHGVANLLLGGWVVWKGAWHFW
ncbi:MAG TPA: CAAX prenyl protease-related protein [Roseimicrobium sp.]|nr:CAAX prenyl protease-related protein [Roseimicrobium sp.]